MKAIIMKVDASEKNKIEAFITSINTYEEMAACYAGDAMVCVSAIGECGIAYAKAIATNAFDNEVKVIVIK